MLVTSQLVKEGSLTVVHLIAAFGLMLYLANPGLEARANDTESTAFFDEVTLTETTEGRMLKPGLAKKKPDQRVKVVLTAYTSTPDQTDGDPFVAASGKRVHERMVAANWLPFGTVIKIPALFGNKEFVVEDRMNKRFGYGRMDVWLNTPRSEAIKFGKKTVEVEIYYKGKKTTHDLELANAR